MAGIIEAFMCPKRGRHSTNVLNHTDHPKCLSVHSVSGAHLLYY